MNQSQNYYKFNQSQNNYNKTWRKYYNNTPKNTNYINTFALKLYI